jgi:hypothetical protein
MVGVCGILGLIGEFWFSVLKIYCALCTLDINISVYVFHETEIWESAEECLSMIKKVAKSGR